MAVDTLRLFGAAARLSTIRLLRSPGEALANTAADFVAHAGIIVAPVLVATRFGHIGPWPAAAVVFMLAYWSVMSSVLDSLSDYNTYFISRRIGRGQLDHSLLEPHPLWRILLTEGFAPLGFLPTLAMGIALLTWSTVRLHVVVSADWIALLVLNVLSSMVVLLSLLYAWSTAAFWAPRGAEEISAAAAGLLGQSSFPLDPLPRALRGLLITGIPTGLLAWLPARALLGLAGAGRMDGWITPMAATAFGAAAACLFRLGLRHYRRTGSTRYTDFGHRR